MVSISEIVPHPHHAAKCRVTRCFTSSFAHPQILALLPHAADAAVAPRPVKSVLPYDLTVRIVRIIQYIFQYLANKSFTVTKLLQSLMLQH